MSYHLKPSNLSNHQTFQTIKPSPTIKPSKTIKPFKQYEPIQHEIYPTILMGFAASAMAQSGDVPPNAQPGKCYAKCHFADVYETTTEQVAVKPATTQAFIVPAEYETKTVYQLVKEASKHYVMIPAQFQTLTDRVDVTSISKSLASPAATAKKYIMVKPESKRYIEVPAVYENVSEPYIIEPATYRIEVLQPRFETVTDRIETKAPLPNG
ncbi:MAG: hypothetical protein IPL27_09040 [Lewinellaceae bacterium]|nr:hypothetical protein [Lewinellaceae bacterium]